MAVTSITSSASVGTTSTVNTGLDSLSGEDFMSILIKQLEYQDPLEPMTNAEMIDQIAKIRELETNTKLSEKLERVGDQERFGSAATLIGKYVRGEVEDDEGNTYQMEGTVTGVRFDDDGDMILELDSGDQLPMENMTRVANSKEEMGDES